MPLIKFSPGIFLSTLSLRRATGSMKIDMDNNFDFYPRSPCGERPLAPKENTTKQRISIHALLAESDRVPLAELTAESISIHALLAESDMRGEHHANSQQEFLSTLSLRRATAKVHKTVGHFCAYETNFMGIASSC